MVTLNQISAYAITGLLGGVPTRLGDVARRWLYRSVFQQVGHATRIKPNVRFDDPALITLGHQVLISHYAEILSLGNPIELDDHVHIDTGASLRGFGYMQRSQGIKIGANTMIGPYACMAGPGAIQIGKNCMIASHCGLYANNHIFADPTRPIADQGVRAEGIVIGEDCWLGTGVKVLDRVEIGRGSVIGAGAVVTRDIPAYSVAVGVPAKVIKRRDSPHPMPLSLQGASSGHHPRH